MKYVYVKDNEGFVCKKLESEICSDETVITEAEFKNLSGDNYYEKKFGHGGARAGAGRKPVNGEKKSIQMRVTLTEKSFLIYARANNLNFADLINSKADKSTFLS